MTDQPPRPQRIQQRRIQQRRARGARIHRASAELNGLPCVSVVRGTRWGNPHD
jgi:hypothetical protein